jgi:hypothetical protein
MQLRKIFVCYWVCWVAAVSPLSRGADTSAVAGPPARAWVVIAENARATVAFEPQPKIVQGMVDDGILKLAGKPDLKQAWRAFISTQDVVGIKVYSGPGANSGTRPSVVGAVIEGLLKAGLAPAHIIIWDKRLLDLRLAGFDDLARRYKVRLAGAADSGYDENVFYDNSVMGNLMAGDLDFDRSGKTTGRNSYLSKLLTRTITKIINVSPLLNHNLAGVCGNLYSLAIGSVDNTLRFEESAERLATAVPEIYAKPALSDHVVLNITDALIGQYQGEQMSLLHYSTQLDQIWLSKDPVALDVLAIHELDRERQERKILMGNDNPGLYKNAAFFLELGEDDLAKIRIDMAK